MRNKTRKSVIALAIGAILTSGAMLSSSVAYADSSIHSSDSDNRGSDSESKKIIICHVPKGNPANRHTIHIGYSAWAAHRDNHGGDYLGSCNNPPSTKATRATTTQTSTEDLVVIKGCTGEYRKKLITLTQSYFDPIIVNDDALDDEATVLALSQCLDKGDSSDSSDSSDSGKKGGHDSVSDSGNHHRISGCKNQDSSDSHHDSSDSKESDSSKNYAKKLREKNEEHNKTKGHGDSSLNISDSSMDDSDVYTEYKKCADSNKEKGDSGKGDSGKGDSGHKYREMKSCSNAAEIKSAIATHREKVRNEAKYEKRAIVIKTSTLTDTHIKAAVDACLTDGGGTKTISHSSGQSGRLNWREITNK